jgi:hypothetical protein
MVDLNAVIQGLKFGKSFKRPLDNSEGFEYVRAINSDMFTHTVAGHNDHGGYGGQSDLSISVITYDRWANHGWIEE